MEYTMLRMVLCGLWTGAKLTRKTGEKKNGNFLKKLWYSSGSVQKELDHWLFWTKASSITTDTSSCHQVWKQGFWR